VNSIDYILKPIDKDELIVAFKKYQSLTAQQPVAPAKMMESIGNASANA
jgi:YesN/AraC family two-component response regulator